MQIKINLLPKQFCAILFWIMIFLAILNLGVQISKYYFHYRQEWMVVFNMDRELNFPTLFTVILLMICAYFLKRISILKKAHQNPYAKYWKTLSFIFWFLSADEAFQIHEVFIIPPLGKSLPGIFHFVWVIPYGIGVIFLIYYFAKFFLSLPKEIRILFFISGCLYIGGALGLEMLLGVWVRIAGGMQNLVYALLASVEEMMEIMGLIVFIYSLFTYIINYQKEPINLQINIIEDKKMYN